MQADLTKVLKEKKKENQTTCSDLLYMQDQQNAKSMSLFPPRVFFKTGLLSVRLVMKRKQKYDTVWIAGL